MFEEANILLITKNLSKSEIFVAEASKSAVIDTAFTKTVAGEQCFNNFVSNLTEKSMKEIEYFPNSTKFKFGDGRQVTAIKCVIFPAVIARKHCKTNAEIVKENIPLLLSKHSLKKCQAVTDMNTDKAAILGNRIDLHLSTSGHYCLDIIPNFTSNKPSKEALTLENTRESDAKITKIKKIHRQFGHASIENMQKLIGNAKLLTKDISLLIKKVVNTCETCIKYCKPNPCPVVAFTKAEDLNQTGSVDLHHLSTNFWYMHLVDELLGIVQL